MGETETRKPAMLRPKPKSAKWKFSAWLLTFTRGTFNFGSLTLANTQRPRRKCRGNSDPKSQSFGAMKIPFKRTLLVSFFNYLKLDFYPVFISNQLAPFSQCTMPILKNSL